MSFPGGTVIKQEWPSWDEDDLLLDLIEIVVQVKGKIRARMRVSPDASPGDMEKEALSLDRIEEILNGSKPRRVIVVPGKLVNVIP